MSNKNLNTEKLSNGEKEKFPVDCLVGLPPLQLNEIYNDDSFRLIERVPAKTVDLILEDMPYNTTACEWDVKIDLEIYWKTRLRILKPTGVVVLTASQPFTSELVLSNYKMFKYECIWNKTSPSGHLNAKKMPLKAHENILVFYNTGNIYNPQGTIKGVFKNSRPSKSKIRLGEKVYGLEKEYGTSEIGNYPLSVCLFGNGNNSNIHPTQKPVGLFEYLIRTYSNENDLVFDGFGGSGTTAIAAHKSKRNFIVIEKEKKYFDLAKRRLENERAQLTML